jgi:hypothetical protein
MSEPAKPKPKRPQAPSQRTNQGPQQTKQERRRRRRPAAPTRVEPTSPRWAKETGPKICQKCGGRMFPADWIWQKYGLCLGWRCANCKERVMARSLPFKGLRKRALDPDEVSYYEAARAAWKSGASESKPK